MISPICTFTTVRAEAHLAVSGAGRTFMGMCSSLILAPSDRLYRPDHLLQFRLDRLHDQRHAHPGSRPCCEECRVQRCIADGAASEIGFGQTCGVYTLRRVLSLQRGFGWKDLFPDQLTFCGPGHRESYYEAQSAHEGLVQRALHVGRQNGEAAIGL